jgi:protein phosphatase
MDAALGNGGRDNVTVIVIDVLDTPDGSPNPSRRAAHRH